MKSFTVVMALVLVLAYVSAQESTNEASDESTTTTTVSPVHRFQFNSISEGRAKALKKVKELLAKAGLKHKHEESGPKEKRSIHNRQPHHQIQPGCQPDYVVEYVYEYEPQYYCY